MPGDVVLVRLPQMGGAAPKLRPALVLVSLPGPYQNVLLCGISTQLHLLQEGWDEVIQPGDTDFAQSGLRVASAARLSYLHAADSSEVAGAIGRVDASRLNGLTTRLANHLLQAGSV